MCRSAGVFPSAVSSDGLLLRLFRRHGGAQPGECLQDVPVGEAVGLPGQQRFGRLSVLAEVLAEAAFGAGEVNEVNLIAGLGVLVPVLLVEACFAPSII